MRRLPRLPVSAVLMDTASSRVQIVEGGIPTQHCLMLSGPSNLQMPAGQFGGLSGLVQLAELDASGTPFDDECCRHLAQLTRLHTIR